MTESAPWQSTDAIVTGTIVYAIFYVILTIVVTIIISSCTRRDTKEERCGFIQCVRSVLSLSVVWWC